MCAWVGSSVGGIQEDDGAGGGLLGGDNDGEQTRQDDGEGEVRGELSVGRVQGNEWSRG